MSTEQEEVRHRNAVLETLKQELPNRHIVLVTYDTNNQLATTSTMGSLVTAGLLEEAARILRGRSNS